MDQAIYESDYWAPIMGRGLKWAWGSFNARPAIKLLQGLTVTPEDGIMGPLTLAVHRLGGRDKGFMSFAGDLQGRDEI